MFLSQKVAVSGGENPHYTDYDSGTGSSGGKPTKGEPQNAINILNSVLLRKSVISKLSRYDLLLGVVKAEAYFAFNGEDVQVRKKTILNLKCFRFSIQF